MSIFLFHRDLRIDDNTGLIKLIREGPSPIIPIFILTIDQIGNLNQKKGNNQGDENRNPYKSNNSIGFMIESLEELRREFRSLNSELYIFYGETIDILQFVIDSLANLDILIQKIGYNRDYTPYAKERSQLIENYFESNNLENQIEIVETSDYTLLPIEDIRTSTKGFYKVFKPYYDKIMKQKIREPDLILTNKSEIKKRLIQNIQLEGNFEVLRISEILNLKEINPNVRVHGGRSNGLKKLNQSELFKNYDQTKDYPAKNTTLLSAYIKYGNVSIREVYYTFLPYGGELLRQLIWHDFYAQLMEGLPSEKTIEGSNYRGLEISWKNNFQNNFKSWKSGETGFPLIDAGMRELNTTGYMHNRARLNVSNFLSLILHIDWKKGEKYFSNQLVDIDLSSNNGNWQWSVQVGIDRPRVWPRIMNPWTQSKKYDPECEYIYQWIPELHSIPPKEIHQWYKYSENYPNIKYPPPIVDFETEKEKGIFLYTQ